MVRLHSPLPFFHQRALWEFSSAGRASALQAEGHRFEPYSAHHEDGLVVQLVRMPACHAGGRRFEPVPGRQLNIFDLKRLNVILWHIIYLVKCRRSQGSLPEDSVRRACLPGSRHGGYRQVVKTQGCGSCIRGFESHYPPHKISARAEQFMMLGYRQVVRQRILIPSSAGSNPATLANYSVESLWA